MTNEFIENLKKLARLKTCSDEDKCPPAYYDCGNLDDSYQMGVSDGQTELARIILEELNISM